MALSRTAAARDATAGAVFAALADPTRRTIVRALAEHDTATASSLAAGLPISRQAVSKHLTMLQGAGLVRSQPAGRETLWRLRPAPLGDAIAWMADAGERWDERLARLERRVSS